MTVLLFHAKMIAELMDPEARACIKRSLPEFDLYVQLETIAFTPTTHKSLRSIE